MKGPRSVMASFVSSSSTDQKAQDQFEIESDVEAMHAVPSSPSLRSSANEDAEDTSKTESSHEVEECVDLRGSEDFRVSFLRKLSYEKVWVPPAQRLPKHQTVIIFDWDDTLLCTTFLQQTTSMSAAVDEQLRGIERTSKQLLELAVSLGKTYIITNAEQGWVEESAAKYVPDLLPVLQRVEIISARTRHGAQYPDDVSMWKIHAFGDLQKQLDLPIITNLVSMGDAKYEMEAAEIIGAAFSEALVKTIKFQENPSPEILLKQLQLVATKFEKIVHMAKPAKINFERAKVATAGGS